MCCVVWVLVGGSSVWPRCEPSALYAALVAAAVQLAYRSYLPVKDWYPIVFSTTGQKQMSVRGVLSLYQYSSQLLDLARRRLLVIVMLYPFLWI
jgi:hypothetical protein